VVAEAEGVACEPPHQSVYPSIVKSSQPAFAATIDPNEEIRLAPDLVEGIKHKHTVNDHGTATTQAARNSTVEVCRLVRGPRDGPV
jgi:hypothetical protein